MLLSLSSRPSRRTAPAVSDIGGKNFSRLQALQESIVYALFSITCRFRDCDGAESGVASMRAMRKPIFTGAQFRLRTARA